MATATISRDHTGPDATHARELRSWVASANGHPDFPIQNLPLGVVTPPGGSPRGAVAIGDKVLDLAAALGAGLFAKDAAAAAAAEAASGASLNAYMALKRPVRAALRTRLSALLADGAPERKTLEGLLQDREACTLHVPAAIGDYTDFFAGINHATNAGKQFRPDNPLLPNYKYVPVAYHSRSSSVVVSGTPVRRPNGQRKPANETVPSFGPSRNLDHELELGIWIGPGNAQGKPIPIAEAADHVAGFCLLNDWSARDVQAWEYQPLGPFLAKSFATTVSPWVITAEALAPFRLAQPPRPEGDPAPLPHLLDNSDQASGAYDIELEVSLLTEAMRSKGLPEHRLALSNTQHLYWTVAQMVAHHASGGCNLRPGDLFGSGTISAPTPDGLGSMLEITLGGRQPITLSSGETRRFLEDGDELIMRARAQRDGFATIGFGECRGKIVPSS
jgi:fumarylacetoacetase